MTTQPRKGFVRVDPPRRPEPRPTPEPKLEGSEPTDEQLCNLAVVAGFPLLATPMFQKMPHWRESLLNLHALYQRAICGDVDAARSIDRLTSSFSDLPQGTPGAMTSEVASPRKGSEA